MSSRAVILAGITGLLLGVFCDGRPPSADTSALAVMADDAVALREDFEHELTDWEFVDGTWGMRDSDGASVLAQTSVDRVFPVALWKPQRFSDVDVRVRFKPLSGRVDASGGIVFRARDGRNYYVVRANSLENNFRLYTVIDGNRRQIAGTGVTAPSLGEWHTLRVVAAGSRIQAYLDGGLLIDHQDDTFQGGYVGLWTKADAVTEFDDLEVNGLPDAARR